jgi:hypothetical protein
VGEFVMAMARAAGKTPETIEAEFYKTARSISLLQRLATTEAMASLVTYVVSC